MSNNLPKSDDLLVAGTKAATPQISQEVLQGVAYNLRGLPSSDELLIADLNAATPQISQEVLQGAAFAMR